jgi:ABC-type lipoprotein release transport system permease subunit
MVLWQNARLAGLGVVVGLGGAWAAARWVASLAPGFEANLVSPYIAVVVAVLGLTQLASWLPARRAARLDVQKALTAT